MWLDNFSVNVKVSTGGLMAIGLIGNTTFRDTFTDNSLPIEDRKLQGTMQGFERACESLIEKYRSPESLDLRLVYVLQNAIRLAREYTDSLKVPCGCQIYETCDECRAPSS